MEICIYSGSDEIEVLQVKEILENNGILTYVKNLHTQNILGATKIFTGMDLLAGDIEIYINENDLDKALSLLNKEIKTVDIENEQCEDENEKNINDISENKNAENIDYYEKSIIGKSFVLSFFTFLISPFFFNIGYLMHLWKNKRGLAIVCSVITLFSLCIGVFMIRYSVIFNYSNIIFGIILIPVLCTIKSISIYIRKKSLLSLLYLFIALIFVIAFGLIKYIY